MHRPAPSAPLVTDLLPGKPPFAGQGEPRLPRIDPDPRGGRPVVFDPTAHGHTGRNFAMQDYLGLAAHPRLRAAAMAALGEHRLCPPGTAACLGLTGPVLLLEDRVAAHLGLPAATAFPSGAEAIRATLRCVIQPGDDVIVDAGAHPAMFETVLTARARLHRALPGSVEAVERRLRRLSTQPRSGRLWVAVPAISAHASVMADLAELADLCQTHGAGLVVDVTHDLGAMGQAGGGVMEIQACQRRADVVVGSFAKCFGVPGGFAAFRDPDWKAELRSGRAGQGRTTALSPVFAAAILAAFDLIDSAEGRHLRRRLHGNTLRLRNHLMADGLRVLGQPSPLVPLLLPAATALARTALLESAGISVTLLRTPVVAAHAPRWRLQLSASHSAADIDDLADLIRDVFRAFDRQPG